MCTVLGNDRCCHCFTPAAVEDELVRAISSYIEFEIDKVNNEIRIRWIYLEQAQDKLYRINIFRPPPEFVIFKKDIPEWLFSSLENLHNNTMKRVMINVVCRIYESVDPPYFHTNGIYGRAKWRIET